MDTTSILIAPLTILAIGVCLDLVFNGGDGIKQIVRKPEQPSVTDLIKDIVVELDNLYKDLDYESDDKDQVIVIRSKIMIRERVLNTLLQEASKQTK